MTLKSIPQSAHKSQPRTIRIRTIRTQHTLWQYWQVGSSWHIKDSQTGHIAKFPTGAKMFGYMAVVNAAREIPPTCPWCKQSTDKLYSQPLSEVRVCFGCMEQACADLAELEDDFRADQRQPLPW